MDEIYLGVRGLREVEQALFSFSEKLGKRVVKGSMREGAKVIQAQARMNAPYKTGRLRKGIVVKNSRIHNGRRSRLIGVYVGLRKGKGRDDPNDAFYGAFIERGWNARGVYKPGMRSTITSRFGTRTGRKTLPSGTNIDGDEFLDKAFEAKKRQAVQVAVEAAKRGAEVVARRTGLKWQRV